MVDMMTRTALSIDSKMEFSDRRYFSRLQTALPVKVEFTQPSGGVGVVQGDITSLSEGGLSLSVSARLSLSGLLHIEMMLPDQPVPLKLTAEICWMRAHPGGRVKEYGLKISRLAETYQSILMNYIVSHAIDKRALKDRRIRSLVSTEAFQFLNRSGRQIVGLIDRPIQGLATGFNSWVIIPPAYGETKTGALSIAYFLASNGIPVIRYDATDHVGESEGKLLNCTLGQMHDDLLDVISFAQNRWSAQQLGIVATSLGARMAMKVAAELPSLNFLGCFVPVVNLQYTLKAVYNEDLVGSHQEGFRRGVIDMLGFPIEADQFLSDAVSRGYHNLATTKNDLQRIQARGFFINGRNDPWVDCREVEEALQSSSSGHISNVIVDAMIHQVHENPAAVKEALRRLTQEVLNCFDVPVGVGGLQDPNFREIGLQARLEKEKLRSSRLRQVDSMPDMGFWEDYLEEFKLISKIPQYLDLFNDVCTSLGSVPAGGRLLDAGCGNGAFGAWVLSQWSARGEISLRPPLNYIGVDYVPRALQEADKHHRVLWSTPERKSDSLGWHYLLSDLTKPLPFLDDYFDAVCCNLVLSYIPQPRAIFQELVRVLKPGARLVVSSLKPNPDLSLIYRSFLEKAENEEDMSMARRLLNNAANVLEKERQGLFKFFSEGDMASLAESSPVKLQSFKRTFGDQVNSFSFRKLE